MRRPSFLPSLDDLEDEVTSRAEAEPRAGGRTFDHPTARILFVGSLTITVLAHLAALVYFLAYGH